MSPLKEILPLFACGKVVKGFGRGSKDLGIPTANLQEEIVEGLPTSLLTGIYYGLAAVDNGTVHKMVMSIGWNPVYKNKKKSMEAHILNKFDEDFYGSQLKVMLAGYIRPEKNFSSLDELIEAIMNDISIAKQELSKTDHKSYYELPFWVDKFPNGVFSYTQAQSLQSLNGLAKKDDEFSSGKS